MGAVNAKVDAYILVPNKCQRMHIQMEKGERVKNKLDKLKNAV